MQKMIVKLFILLFILTSLSCYAHRSGSWFLSNKNKRIYKTSSCNLDKPFPQMVMIPFFKSSSQIIPNCNTYPKHQTAMALMIFYHHWIEYFGDEDLKVKNMLEQVMITWDTKKRTAKRSYNLYGESKEGRDVTGITLTNTTIWVWEGYFHKISESSLMHELVHLALRARNGHGDRDHEGNRFEGWTRLHSELIYEAKETLRSFDI